MIYTPKKTPYIQHFKFYAKYMGS